MNKNTETENESLNPTSSSPQKSKTAPKKRSKYFDYDENGRKKRKKIKKIHYNLGWIIFIIFIVFLAAFFLYMRETLNNKNFLQEWLNEHPEDISVSSTVDDSSRKDENNLSESDSESNSNNVTSSSSEIE